MPATRVFPLRSPATVVAPDLPAASRYPVVKAAWAWAAAPSAEWIAPLASPGGNPVTAVPGLTPTSPETRVEPVLVTVEPARTAKSPIKGQRATVEVPPPWHGPVVKVCRNGAARATPPMSLAPVVTVIV